MHLQTHILASWCIGSALRLTPRERFFCMAAGAMADLDGLSMLGGEAAFAQWHHVLGHNVFFGLLLATILAAASTHRLKAMVVYLVLFHLHLVMDYYGSGFAWRIHYLWPWQETGWRSAYGWPLTSWQNKLAAVVCIGWTIIIAVRAGRTPFELLPAVDRQVVTVFRKWFGRRRAASSPTSPRA